MNPRSVVFAVMALLLLGHAVAAADPAAGSNFPTAPLGETVLRMAGDPERPAMLQVTLLTPRGPGPFPLAIMNHGSADSGESPAAMPRYRASFVAYYFLSRGYAVALPMMRGFAGSDGRLESYRCDIVRFGLENAKDILAVTRAMRHDPRIDASRVVVAGQSMGGWNSLAFGAIAPPEVRGVLNFNGGVRTSHCDDQDRALADGAGRLGKMAKAPTVWFYTDNDQLFPPPLWRKMYDRYTGAGGRAQMVDVGEVGRNGHKFTASGESLKFWTPTADAFLDRIGMPSAPLYPQYLPMPPPPPSRFAAVDDVAAVPYLNEAGRAEYRKFLAAPLPRALVLAPNGMSEQSDGFDPLATALRNCRARFAGCAVYAVDNDVVWVPPARRTFNATVSAGTTANLNFAVSLNPDCSSRGPTKAWVSQPPQHGSALVVPGEDFPRFPPASPYAHCNTVRVPGVRFTYTPTPGFAGPDTVTFEAISPDSQDRVIPIAITVK